MIELEPDGATPIDPDEGADLIPRHIYTREELNLWEQENILEAVLWSEKSRFDVLDESFVRRLHRRMFDRTWRWAGRYRTSDKNIGLPWPQIPEAVKTLTDDGSFWLVNETFPIDETALRLHHRLVLIHPFPNGNGRHARLWCDLLLRRHGRPPLEWKRTHPDRTGAPRKAYIKALRAADTGDYEPLIRLILTARPPYS